MTPEQVLYYASTHGGTVIVGTQESLISALRLEQQGKLTRVGQEGRNYRFNITSEGSASVRAPNRVRVVRGAAVAGRAVQRYATAFKDDQRTAPPIIEAPPRPAPRRVQPQPQSSDLGYMEGIGGEGYLGINPSDYPALGFSSPTSQPRPMVQPPPQRKQHPRHQGRKKDSRYIVVNGKRYRRD